MPEPELHVRDFTPPVPVHVCESGRHIAHPGDTCEDIDQLQALFRAYLERAAYEAFVEADRRLIFGEGSGEPLGFFASTPDRGPTAVERAFAILDPHLRACPLYKAGPPRLPTVRP